MKCIGNFYRINGIGVQGDPIAQIFYIGDGLFQLLIAAQLFICGHKLGEATVVTADVPAYQLQLRTLHTVGLQRVRDIPDAGEGDHRVHLRLIFQRLMQDRGGTLLPTHTDPDQRILSGILHGFIFAFFRQGYDLAPLQPEIPLCGGKIAQSCICLHGQDLDADIVINRIIFREIKHGLQRIDPVLNLESKGILVIALDANQRADLRRLNAVAGHDGQIVAVAGIFSGDKLYQ